MFGSPMGWSYRKLIEEAGLKNYYLTGPDENDKEKLFNNLNNYKPPIVITLDSCSGLFYPKCSGPDAVRLYAGSLLSSERLGYNHYILPTLGPQICVTDWTERQIVKYVDYGKAITELEFFNKHGFIQPLPQKDLKIEFGEDQLINMLEVWSNDDKITHLSVDIETIYPKEKSNYYGHPGYPVTVGIAPSSSLGISFNLFLESTEATARLWKALAKLFRGRRIIGQNFFGFDCWFFNMLGIYIDRSSILDTMFRHAVLWPELSHKLEFMTRQYTRQPYYKSEGKGWSMKNLSGLKRYNALDVVTTFDVYLEQEKEFDDRPHLR